MPTPASLQSRSRPRSIEASPDRRPRAPSATPKSPTNLPLFLQHAPGGVVRATRVVNDPDDTFEREADAVSGAVAASTGTQLSAEAAPPGGASETAPLIDPPDAGTPLRDDVRARVEPAVGMPLGEVRVHDSPAARADARALQARAFTHRNHIWLGPNQRADDVPLLAHEATHVRHQAEAASSGGARRDIAPIQRTPDDAGVSVDLSTLDPQTLATSSVSTPLASEAISSETVEASGVVPDSSLEQRTGEVAADEAAADEAAREEGQQEEGGGEAGAEAAPDAQAGEGGETEGGAGGEGGGGGGPRGGGGGGDGEGGAAGAAPMPVEETGAGALETGDLVLIDVELAEHQRWEGALGRVGAAGSVGRAEFIAEAVGSGFISGAASGLAMGLGIGLVTRAVPAIGPVIGGAMALHGLVTRDWSETGATIGRFGEGNSTYEVLANTIASVAAVIDIVSQVLTVINGIVGIVQIAAAVIAGGAVVAAFFTFGATLGIAAIAADVVAVCEEISLGINAVTAVLDTVNAAILQPAVTLFRALHAFTTQADPREVESQGQSISTAAAASGAALGAWAGGRASQIGSGARPQPEDLPPSQRQPHETPPPAGGDGPTVRFEEPPALPPAHAEGVTPTAADVAPPPVAPDVVAPPPAAPDVVAPPPVAPDVVAPPPVAPDVATPTAAAPDVVTPRPTAPEVATPRPAAPEVVAAPPAAARPPEQLTLPGTEAPTTRPPRRPPSPDEVAPADTHSAWLRRLRAEAEGGPPPPPGRRAGNIARHELPDRSSIRGTWESTSPTPDLYQYSPRQPRGHESHHVEQQSAFRAPDGGEVIAGYNPREDPTVMMRRTPEHEATFEAQAQQRAQPDFHETVGRPQALEEAYNIAVWGTRDAPPPGTSRPQLMDPEVAGQTVMEHASYLFETTRLSGDITAPEGVTPRPGETPLADRPTVGELVAPRGGVDPFENIDWDRTFDQPDPYRAAQPPGTQFALPGMEHLAPPPPPAHQQLTLPRIDQPAPNPNQLSLDFTAPPRTPTPETPPTPPAAPPPMTPAPETPPPSSTTPLTPTPQTTPEPPPTPTPTTPTTPETPLPTPRPPSPTPETTSSSTSTGFSAAAGAARSAVAQQTPGGPQPGTESPTWGTRAQQVGALFLPQVFGGGGPAPTYEQQRAAHRARFTEDNQPAEGVERVNPEYPPPPGTPEQITAIQNEIMNLLTVRATAEQEAQTQQGRAEVCEENQGPIQQTVEDTSAGISAVAAHDAAVARRQAVNQEQQQRQAESQGLVAGYPSRAAGVAALTVPLAAWEGFTSLASHLPGDAGAAMQQMNAEARQMQESFDTMAAEMLGVDEQGPEQQAELQGDQGRLEATGEQAVESDSQLQTASEGADGLQQANEAALAEARQREQAATGRAEECDAAVAEREQRADTLAEQLRAWAQTHAGARRQAIAATEARLAGEGRTVIESTER